MTDASFHRARLSRLLRGCMRHTLGLQRPWLLHRFRLLAAYPMIRFCVCHIPFLIASLLRCAALTAFCATCRCVSSEEKKISSRHIYSVLAPTCCCSPHLSALVPKLLHTIGTSFTSLLSDLCFSLNSALSSHTSPQLDPVPLATANVNKPPSNSIIPNIRTSDPRH